MNLRKVLKIVTGLLVAPSASAVLGCAACMLICSLSFPVLFETNDDIAIQTILSGALSGGEPEPHTYFINYFLGLLVASLFRLNGNVPWWYLTHVLVLGASICLFNYALVTIARRLFSKIGTPLLLTGAIFIDIILFCYPIVRMQFTTTPAVASGCAIVSIPLLFDSKIGSRTRLNLGIFHGILLLLSCWIRLQSGLIGLVFYALLFCTICMVGKSSGIVGYGDFSVLKPQSLVPILVCMLLLGATIACDKFAYQSEDWRAFSEINRQRSQFMDYPHPAFEESPDVYRAVGWSESDYELIRRWCFMVDSASLESFEEINEANPSAYTSGQFDWIAAWFWRAGVFSSLSSALSFSYFVLLFVCAAIFSRHRAMFISYTLSIAISFALLSYLSLLGRLIPRVASAVLFPSAMLAAGGLYAEKCLINVDPQRALPGRITSLSKMIALFFGAVCIVSSFLQDGGSGRILYFLLGLCLLSACALDSTNHPSTSAIYHVRLSLYIIALGLFALSSYLAHFSKLSTSNPQTLGQITLNEIHESLVSRLEADYKYIYIVPTTENSTTNPLVVSAPSNVFSWGGWTYYMPFQQDELNSIIPQAGLLSLRSLVDVANVRLVTSNSDNARLVGDYLNSVFSSEVICEACGRAGDYIIYRYRTQSS